MPLFYNAFDILCFPSIAGFELCSSVVLEGMACGLPIIATDFDGVTEFVKDVGVLVEASEYKTELCGIAASVNPLEFSESIRNLLEDKSERERLGQSARERALKFTWDFVANEIIQLFQRLNEKRASPHLSLPKEGERVQEQRSKRAKGQEDKRANPSFGHINPVKNNLVGFLRFEDVSFGYVAKRDVLKNINFEVSPGMIIGLVGPSGVGKTTLVRLIPGFYVPTKGRILMDGIDAQNFDLRWLRRQIGIVAQDNILFSGTLRENIAYAQRKAPIDEIETAAKMAQIHEFIAALPEGYDTKVGERGVKLSGGQRQRIAIARMIIANPRIVILDEATSFLDTETEVALWAELRPWLQERTTLAIAHRLSTIEDADSIFVLNSGRIVEQGSHEKLYNAAGFYRQLYDYH